MLVGVLQSAGLALVDAHSSRLVSATDDNTTVTAAGTSSRLIDSDARVIEPQVPFWLFSLHRYLSNLSVLSTALYLVNKGVDLTGLLGGQKTRLGVWGTEVPQRGPGAEPQ